jgi:hypothetical protein
MNLFILSSCERENFSFGNSDADNSNGTVQSEGTLSLASVKLSVVLNDITIVTRTDESSKVDVSGFYVTIKNAGGTQMASWKYSEMPEIFALAVGTYTVEAASVEGAEPSTSTSPYYYGSTTVDIKANTVSEVTNLVCSMKSVMVTVEYDDDLKALLDVSKDAVATIYLNNDASTATTFSYGTTTAYYLKAADKSMNTLKATLEATIDGIKVSNTATFTNVGQGEHRVIRFHLVKSDTSNNGSGGYATVTVNVDATCETVPVTIDITDQNQAIEDFPSDTPGDDTTTIPGGGDEGDNNQGGSDNEGGSNEGSGSGSGSNDGNGNTNSYTLSIVGDGFDIANQTLNLENENKIVVLITASNGIQNLWVSIDTNRLDSEDLNDLNLADRFDLANPATPAMDNQLHNVLKFPTKDEVKGKTYLEFDISGFIDMMKAYGYGSYYNFGMEVIDQENNSKTETLKLIYQK